MPQPDLIFISYARRDGGELARRLKADLEKAGFDSWLDTSHISGGSVWSIEIERELDNRQITVALLSPGSYVSEICRAEQLRALDKGNRVIPVLAMKDAQRPIHLYVRQYIDFSSDSDYEASFHSLLAAIRTGDTAKLPDAYRRTRVTYLTAPPRVANYLHRPEAVRALRDALFAEDVRQPIALTALAGMGGIGKTVLAKALTEDEVVQRAFPDGIVWITAGKERRRDFIAEMREVAKALGDDPALYDSEAACEHQYRSTIADKAALIVVDDVWSKTDVEPLLAESPRSRFLFTTRDRSIGSFVGAREHRAELLDLADARELLARWASRSTAELPAVADEMIAECGRLPLAISVIGALLRGADAATWKDSLDLLRNADLAAIEDQLPAGQQSFFKAVEVSFQALKPDAQERYKNLAVLLEDMTVPVAILQTLWGIDEAQARRFGRQLVDRSLAQQDGDGIRLHDLQLDYIRAQYADRDTLEHIHRAVRLSAHVLARDPRQFASQMVGRLLDPEEAPAIRHFTESLTARAPKPWLRPLHPALQGPGASLIRTLEGHTRAVNCVVFSADGSRAASASDDGTLKVWDVESGSALKTLTGHASVVRGVALCPDGRRAVSAADDKKLKVWDLDSGAVLNTLVGRSGRVHCVAVSPDGRRLISGTNDKTVKVWDLESGSLLMTLEGHKGPVYGVAVSPDGRRVISGSNDSTVRVWDADTGSVLMTLEGHSGPVWAVAVSQDGRFAISASWDKTMKVWDLHSGRAVKTLEGNSSGIRGVAISPDGRCAVSAANDKTLRLWDLESGRILKTMSGHFAGVRSVAISSNGKRAISASNDSSLKVWDLEGRRASKAIESHRVSVMDVVTGADGQLVISVSSDKTLKVWDVESGRVLRTLEGHAGPVLGADIYAGGHRAISASRDTTLRIWDLENGSALKTLEGHQNSVHCVSVLPDGKRAVSGSRDMVLKLWDLESGSVLATLEGHTGPVMGVCVDAEGRRAVSASRDTTLKVWDLESGSVLTTLEGHGGTVSRVAISPDGQFAVSASWDKTMKLWDLESGRAIRTFEGHSGAVVGAAFSRDGRLITSASYDNTVKVWKAESGGEIASFTCDAPAGGCAMIGSSRIVAGDGLGRIHWLELVE